MTKDELKQDFYFELRDRFRTTTDPYQDVTGWALTDFIAEYLANKLAICSVSNRFNYKSFIIGCMVGATICIGILHVLL